MYEFIKEHRAFVHKKGISQAINPHDLLEFYLCNSSNQSCLEDNCSACSVLIKLDMEDGDASSFSVFQWTKVQKNSRKISVHLNLTELVNKFNTQVSTLKKNIFVKRYQNNYYSSLKNNLKGRQLLINFDYSENYVNQEQLDIQSADFGHECFSIFTACCYS